MFPRSPGMLRSYNTQIFLSLSIFDNNPSVAFSSAFSVATSTSFSNLRFNGTFISGNVEDCRVGEDRRRNSVILLLPLLLPYNVISAYFPAVEFKLAFFLAACLVSRLRSSLAIKSKLSNQSICTRQTDAIYSFASGYFKYIPYLHVTFSARDSL